MSIKKIEKSIAICPICQEKLLYRNKLPTCKNLYCVKYRKFNNSGYKLCEIERKIKESFELDKLTIKFNPTENNPTYLDYWKQRGFNKIESSIELRKLKKTNIEFWLDRGYTKEESEILLCKHLSSSIPSNMKYWTSRGYSDDDALIKVNDNKNKASERFYKNYKREYNCLTKEFWLNKGLSEEDSILEIKKVQNKRFSHLTSDDYSKSKKLGNFNLKQNTEKFDKYREKLSNSNKKNIYKSPIFKEYWLNKGYSLDESIKKVLDTKFEFREGSIKSKIEIKFLDELQKFLNTEIKRSAFRYINGNYFCYDGKIRNFVLEFNGTFIHLDKRFYNENSINPYGMSFSQRLEIDNNKINKTLSKYNILIIWEYDYLNNKEKLFNNLKHILENEINKKGMHWDSRCI